MRPSELLRFQRPSLHLPMNLFLLFSISPSSVRSFLHNHVGCPPSISVGRCFSTHSESCYHLPNRHMALHISSFKEKDNEISIFFRKSESAGARLRFNTLSVRMVGGIHE
jgi:hypothetical protein